MSKEQVNGSASSSASATVPPVNGSAVASANGKLEVVPDLTVPTNRIYNFVEQNRKTYFDDHGLEWCLDEIISRGIAEIKRQVKTAQKTAENKAAGAMLKQFNLSPVEAQRMLVELATLKASQEKPKA